MIDLMPALKDPAGFTVRESRKPLASLVCVFVVCRLAVSGFLFSDLLLYAC